MNIFILVIFGLFGFAMFAAGIVLVILGFAQDKLGFKVGGLVAIFQSVLFIFLVLFNLFIAYTMDA